MKFRYIVVEIVNVPDCERDAGSIRCWGPFDTYEQARLWSEPETNNIPEGNHAFIERLVDTGE